VAFDRVPILMYHRLGEVRKESIVPGHYVAPSLFDRQLRLLRSLRMESISLETMRRGFLGEVALPRRPVVVTFDDGYESFSTLGMPLLRKYGLGATVFLVSENVGGLNEWDRAIGDVVEPLMSRDQILDADRQGIEFGAHTRTHARLSEISSDAARSEIRGSKEDLESWIGRPIDYFCYPYGAQTDAVRGLVREAGFLGATGTAMHGNQPDMDPYLWGRINVRYNYTALRLLRRILKARRS